MKKKFYAKIRYRVLKKKKRGVMRSNMKFLMLRKRIEKEKEEKRARTVSKNRDQKISKFSIFSARKSQKKNQKDQTTNMEFANLLLQYCINEQDLPKYAQNTRASMSS